VLARGGWACVRQGPRSVPRAGAGSAPTPRLRRLAQPVPVSVAGVVFMDKIHGQTGVAPKGGGAGPGDVDIEAAPGHDRPAALKAPDRRTAGEVWTPV
jgi:hypothetical protein